MHLIKEELGLNLIIRNLKENSFVNRNLLNRFIS